MPNAQNVLNTVHDSDPIGFWDDGTFLPKEVVKFIGLKQADVARISNVNTSSVRYDQRIPDRVRIHLLQFANICAIVAGLFDNNIDKTKLWIETSNPALGGISPKQMIRFGKYKKLLKFVQLAEENAK